MAGIAVAILLLPACAKPLGNYFAPTAAVVNGEKIPEGDITRELRNARSDPQFENLFKGKDAAANRREAERQILSRLIERFVLAQAAPALGIIVSESEIDQGMKQVSAQFGSEKELDDFLAQQYLSRDRARTFLRRQSLITKVQQEVGKDATVPEEQVRQYYDQNKATYDEQLKIAHILVCESFDPETQACNAGPSDESLAKTIADRARRGEDFSALAAQYSKDARSARTGGDIGWLTAGQANPFEQAASALGQPGAISDPVQSQSGFHVLKLLAKGRPFEDASPEIEQLLLRPIRQEAFQSFLRQALERAKIRVNPRYGRFDRATFQIVPHEPGNGA